MVNVDKIKMSKSLGNFKTIKDLLKIYSGEIIRYFVINAHYRKPIDFSEEKLNESKVSLDRLKNLTINLVDDGKENKKYLKEFEKNMDEDLNTAGALNVIWKLVKDEKAEGKYQTIKKIDSIFGLKLLEKEKLEIPTQVQYLIDERKLARENKDFAKSDELRNKIKELGFEVKDIKDEQRVKKL
jgi:cysteinyl-tRNA synthetase